MPLNHFACETYENVIKEYAPTSKKRKRLNKVLGINIRDKIDESKVDTTDSMYPEYQKIWGLLNSIQLRGECTKRKKICQDASWTLPALPEEGCTCPDVCKIGPVSKSFNPFKKKKYECNCVVKDDEMPTQIVHDDHAEDFNVVNECFDETTGQPKSFLLRHYCKMPRTSVAIFPLDPYVTSVYGVASRRCNTLCLWLATIDLFNHITLSYHFLIYQLIYISRKDHSSSSTLKY